MFDQVLGTANTALGDAQDRLNRAEAAFEQAKSTAQSDVARASEELNKVVLPRLPFSCCALHACSCCHKLLSDVLCCYDAGTSRVGCPGWACPA